MNLALPGSKLSAAIILPTLLLSALFLAKGATNLAAGALLPPQPVAARRASGQPVPLPPGAQAPDAHEILKRNIFDPTTGPLWPPKPVDPVATGDDQENPPEEQPVGPYDPNGPLPEACDGSTKMVASMYSDRYPDWSFVSLTGGSDNALLYRTGGHMDDKQVVWIYPKAVVLLQSNKYCSLRMFAPPGQPMAGTPSRTPPVAPRVPAPPIASALSMGGISEAEMDQNIHAVSDTKFGVQRTFVDKILQNQAAIMSSARVVPHEENGQVVGVKLYGIRRNSLLGKLGLQNGDLLRTINGFEMSSPDTALEAYARLRSASNLSVAVVRRGQALNIQYDITQ